MLNLRRRHSRWRMFLILLFLGMICSGELTPIHVLEESPSLSSSTTKKKDIGSLSDWQAWLLTDTQSFQSGSDTYPGDLRRIMPKSIFIAPGLCPEGYDADQMGRCVKSISLNATAHNGFLLERLKFRYSNSQASKNDQKKSTGPLQLNIPLVLDINRQTNSEVDETFSTNQPVTVRPTRNETYFTRGEEKTKPHETNSYQVKNDTTLNEEESTFFLENSNLDDVRKSDQKPQTTISIAELIEETNDTNFSEIVDYKIPIDLKTLLNSSSVKKVNVSDGTEESVSIAEKRENSTETSPALVLLISPTKLTNVVDDLLLTQNDTEQIAQMSTVTSSTSTKESITVRALDPTTLPPTKQLTPLDEQRDNETYAEDELTPETAKPNESQETDFYDAEEDDEDYPYSTDVPEDEDSIEGEEILKHGEAGMTIPTRDVERLDRDRHQRQRNQTADLQKKMLDIDDRVMIRFNDSAPTEDKDEAGSSISSEVSIDGDFILETTLLDVNTERLQVTTQSPDVTEKIIKDSENNSEEFDKRPDVAPEVVFSQDAHGRKRTEQLSTKLENERNEELEAAPSSSESLLYDSPEEDSVTEIRASEKQLNTRYDSKTLQGSSKDTQSYFPASSSQRTTMNLDSAEDFVRFPDYVRQPQQSNYVRFPSNEANSIHSLSYKQNSRYPADDVGPYGGTSTKSSVPIRQKPVYYLPSSWKLDRSQPDHIQTTANERDRNRRPELMSIWSKMPLIRDPAIYPIYQDDEATDDDQKQPRDRFFRARLSRRLSPVAETSPGNRVPTQKRRTPINV